uniref:Uncharacterized protein n=1 Tax=Moniliophthora roreri TaxID=221103 RepID=A0A0W0G0J3_MONRR
MQLLSTIGLVDVMV